MGIDPRIILGIQHPNFDQPDPLERAGKSLALKGLMGQQEMQAMQMQQARQAAADEEGVRQATIQSGGDSAALRALLQQRGAHKQIRELDKFELEKRGKEATIGKDTAAAGKSNFDVQMGKLQHGAALLDQARDQGSWEQALRVGAMTGVFAPEFVSQMGEQPYSPQLVAQLKNAGMTRAQQLKVEHDRATLAQTAATSPFTPGATPGAPPVPNAPVQAFQLDKAKRGAANVSVRTDVKTGESLAAQIGPMMKESTIAAEGAVKQADAARRVVQAVDTGKIIAGPGAEPMLVMAQIGDALGISGANAQEKIANTRQALRGLAELTLQGRQQMRGQGAITESEGKLAERAMSAEINMTPAEIRQLARASERAARFQHTEHARKLKVMQDNPDLTRMAPFYQGPGMPAEVPDAAPAPARQDIDAELRRRGVIR